MQISLNWLKDYLDIKAETDVEQLCQSLTMAGLEVESVTPLKDFNDVVITLGVTPNRADALSHLGISRELAAILDLGTRSPMLSLKEMAGPVHEKVSIEIENAEDCPRYALRVIENVKVQESPDWIQKRLEACGIRPINNIVDITNYVMLDRGQPMHAFDFDRLAKDGMRLKISVRRACDGEKITVLEGSEIELSAHDVVIADAAGPIALAGVIGGSDSAISHKTTTVVLESAYFEPKNVRLSARHHNFSTESSYRFERGTDPNGVVDALNYAARLIVETSEAKACRDLIDAYRKRIDPLEIHMRPERAQEVLGMDPETFDQDILRRKFLRLGIETVAKRGDAIYFRVPTFRSDLTREIDLIEEAARMIGYDKVNESLVGTIKDAYLFTDPKIESALKKLRARLVARGFLEAINYAFISKEYQKHFINDSQELVEVLNPLSERYSVMRASLIPGLVKNVLHNQRNQEPSIQLFEIGTVFLGKRGEEIQPNPDQLSGSLDSDSFAVERQYFSGVMTGLGSYRAFDAPETPRDFYHLKGVLSECLSALGLGKDGDNASLSFSHGAQECYVHPGHSISVFIDDEWAGCFGKLHPDIASSLDVEGDVFVFEFDLHKISNQAAKVAHYKAFSRFPAINRDVAFVMDESVLVGDIFSLANEINEKYKNLCQVSIFDVYRGKNIGDAKKSVAFRLSFQHQERTLVDEDVDVFMQDFIDKAREKTGATVR
ncbi:MAG: phenylalanine--tRNA ligase subunit beta [Myxococcales bacterium]|nr:phenylalanine--tRNA ligase subunit beta [Myxococcales bacterium]USN51233.1 MAG: phenylalanine--tRNA ligase subunit beta [Myxococcales bacterium]